MYQFTGEYVDKGRVYLDSARMYIQRKINQHDSQCRMVLIVVSMALLLDNMLYMVIVPVVPYHLAWLEISNSPNKTEIIMSKIDLMPNKTANELDWLTPNHNEKQMGVLFACKAIVQLLVNPLSGTIIDRIGYDIPMMIGLIIIFVATTAFAYGSSIDTMMVARGLQGVGSAFADTAGLAMIADRFTEENARTTALGIALAFISFGSLVAPPFGGIMYANFGKESPFLSLAFIALLDGFMLIMIMKPVRLERRELQAEGHLSRGTPIQKLLMDPYIAICAGCLTVANISLAFLEPTMTNWMISWNPKPSKTQLGLAWLPSFFPHVAGVYTTVKLAKKYPKYQWLMAGIGLLLEGIGCLFIPVCDNYVSLMIPLCILCYGIALVDTAILPTLGYIVDTRHLSVYGSVYAIADISYSLAYALGPIVAGAIVNSMGFTVLNIVIFVSTIAYIPILYLLRNIHQGPVNKFDNLNNPDGSNEIDSADAKTMTEILKPGRKKSYLMNGTSLESKNIGNINSADFQAKQDMETNALIQDSGENYRSGARNIDNYNTISMRNPISDSPTPPPPLSALSSVPQQSQNQSQPPPPTTYSSSNIRSNQYGY